MINFDAVVKEASKITIASLQGADIDLISLMIQHIEALDNAGYSEGELTKLLEVIEANRQLYFQGLPLQHVDIGYSIKELNEGELLNLLILNVNKIPNPDTEISYPAFDVVLQATMWLYISAGGAVDDYIDLNAQDLDNLAAHEKLALEEERIGCIATNTRKRIAMLTSVATKAGMESLLRGILKDTSVAADIERWKADGNTTVLNDRLSGYTGTRIRGYLDYKLPDADGDGYQMTAQQFIIGYLAGFDK